MQIKDARKTDITTVISNTCKNQQDRQSLAYTSCYRDQLTKNQIFLCPGCDWIILRSLALTPRNKSSKTIQIQVVELELQRKILLRDQFDLYWWRCTLQDLLKVPISRSSTDSIQIQTLHLHPKSPLIAGKSISPALSKLSLFWTKAFTNIHKSFPGFTPSAGPSLIDGIIFSLARLDAITYTVTKNIDVIITRSDTRQKQGQEVLCTMLHQPQTKSLAEVFAPWNIEHNRSFKFQNSKLELNQLKSCFLTIDRDETIVIHSPYL